MSHSILEAYVYCESLARKHYENFPVGSLLIPKSKRRHVFAIYAFARLADDFADENYPPRENFESDTAWREAICQQETERLEKLNHWDELLQQCRTGEGKHPIFIALGKTLQEMNLPLKPFEDLLKAFKQDVKKRRYQNWEEVLEYCNHSANPVGELILRLFGYTDPALFEMSNALCTGLQLANFWQDIAVDLKKDRLYIPLDLLSRHSLSAANLFDSEQPRIPSALFEELGNFTKFFFDKGRPLPSKIRGRLSWELKCTWLGGMTILNRACFDLHRRSLSRPHLNRKDQFLILWKSIVSKI